MTPWLRYVHPDLLAGLQSRRMSHCRLLKISPRNGAVFGIAALNRSVSYDDGAGDGAIVYCARYGFDASAIAASAGTSIDNAEITALLGVDDSENAFGITAAMIDSGYLDGARFVQYLVDYEDLGTGKHAELQSGRLGEVRVPATGMCIVETRSRMQQLAQHAMCQRGSMTCLATHGDSTTGCYFDAEPTWVTFTVDSVPEPDRQFQSNDLTQADAFFFPGRTEWLTGGNAGRGVEVESFAFGGTVTLAHITRAPVQVGDTGRIRPDCTKKREGPRGCIEYGQVLNMRAQPDRPEGDTRTLQTPRPTR